METYELSPERLKFHAFLEFAGLDCFVRSNSRLPLSALSLWRNASKRADKNVELWIAVDYDRQPGLSVPVKLRFAGQRVAATFHSNEVFTFDLRERCVRATISSDTAQDERFWNVDLLPLVLEYFGPGFGVISIRSACVTRDGDGILIVGAPGSGKTCLSIALARSGFEHVSGEVTYVRAAPTGVEAFGMLVPLKLPNEAVEFFPELQNLQKLPAGDTTLAVEPVTALNLTQASNCLLKAIVFLNRVGPGHSFKRMHKDDARDQLLKAVVPCVRDDVDLVGSTVQVLEELLKMECWDLQVGPSPQHAALALTDHLAQMAGQPVKTAGAD